MHRYQTTIEATISNETTTALPALQFPGKIVVVDKIELIESACNDLASYPMIGFDTETRPSFKAGISYKVSLLQLSTPSCCYLFRLNLIPLSEPIIQLLESESVKKIGADVAGDIHSLLTLKEFKSGGFIDLQSLIWRWGVQEKSLRKMAAITLGFKISKAQRLSNWEAVQLTEQQKNYAATDAWACTEIYEQLLATTPLSDERIAEIEQEMAERAAASAARKAEKLALRRAKLEAAGIDPDKFYKKRRTKRQ